MIQAIKYLAIALVIACGFVLLGESSDSNKKFDLIDMEFSKVRTNV